jgi:hypothetical protein
MGNPFSPSCPNVALYGLRVSWILRRMFAECLSSRLSYCRYLTKRVRCTLPSWGSGRDVTGSACQFDRYDERCRCQEDQGNIYAWWDA